MQICTYGTKTGRNCHMDWDDLRYVLATARSGSFLGASERLKVAHTTVGRRIKLLERDLGRTLFKRTRDGVTPTEFCNTLLPTAETIELQVQKISLARDSESAQPEGSVRIHTAPWIIEHILVPGLPTFHREFPRIQLHLVGDVVDSITDRSVPSLSIRAEVMAKRDEVEMELVDIPVSVFHHRDSDPENLPWVSSHAGKMLGSQVKWMDSRGIPISEIAVLMNDAELVRRAVATGAYQGLMAHYLARLSPELVRTNTGRPDHYRKYRCITQRRTVSTPEVQAVYAWVTDTILKSGIGDA